MRSILDFFFFGLLGIFCIIAHATPLASTEKAVQPRYPLIHESGGDEYVVIFNNEAPQHRDVLARVGLQENHPDVRRKFNNTAFRGFTARMKSHCIDALGLMPDVMLVEKSVPVTASMAIRPNSPWGLQRISSTGPTYGDPHAVDYTYAFRDPTIGAGADVYIVDTGINTANVIFGGRARMGYSFEGDDGDAVGHGSHVSGTAAGVIFGVASNANIIGVKVLGNTGAGTSADTIAGMDFVIASHGRRRNEPDFKGSIMSMSWGLSSTSRAIQAVISHALANGVHVSMAAGNSGGDACAYSPSQAGGANSAAVSVGSVGMSASISSFSNTGACVDIYAPGEEVLSAWTNGTNVVQFLSGTSMACPHVTGVMAYLLAAGGNADLRESPSKLKDRLLALALRDVVQGSALSGDGKLLLNNGVKRPAMHVRLGSRAVSLLEKKDTVEDELEFHLPDGTKFGHHQKQRRWSQQSMRRMQEKKGASRRRP